MNDQTLKTILLVNLIIWFLVALGALITAHGTGLLLGGAAFNASLAAYLIQRHTRYTLEVGKKLNEETMEYAIDRFVPFNKCEPSLQVKLLPCIDPLVEDLKHKVVQGKRPQSKRTG